MINRYFSPENLKRFKQDFSFLIKITQTSLGEIDISIRDNYFNIYYRGNSLAKITFKKDNNYRIDIHTKFLSNTSAKNPKYYNKCIEKNNYFYIDLSKEQLHPFLQKKHIAQIATKIKVENYSEELNFEQTLITDNINNNKIIFIDRQVTDSKLNRKRLDLLALKQISDNKYQFLIAEIKLGNNKELKDKVALQLEEYIDHIKQNFILYKRCYEIQYKQKKNLGLIQRPNFASIEIVEPVDGIVIVNGYSGIAKLQIKELKDKKTKLKIKHFTYRLTEI